MIRVLCPGSYDPVTYGHMDIIKQASKIFDEIIVVILNNPMKKDSFFTVEERLAMIRELYKDMKNIKVVAESGAAVDVAMLYECKAIVRGLRNSRDYDDEVQLAQLNKELSDDAINTVCLFADKEYQFISSTKVREVFKLGKDISRYVPPLVKEKMLVKKGMIKSE